MQKLKINIEDRTVEASDGFSYPLTKRFFNLYALLILKRIEPKSDSQGWVDLDLILDLPFWEKNTRLSAGKQVSRHISEMKKLGKNVIAYLQKVNGPFRIGLKQSELSFDGKMADLKELLYPDNLARFDPTDNDHEFDRYIEMMWKAAIAFNQGDPDKEFECYAQAVPPGDNIEKKILVWHKFIKLAQRTGRFEIAGEFCQAAYNLIREMRPFNYLLMAENRTIYASLYLPVSQFNQAEKLYHEAQNLLRGKIHYQIQGEIYNGLGKINAGKKQYTKAEALYKRALSSWQAINYFYGIHACYINIAHLYYGMAEDELRVSGGKMFTTTENLYKKAIEWGEKCIDLCKMANLGRDSSRAQMILTSCHYRLNNYEKARVYAVQAKNIAERSKNYLDLRWANPSLAEKYREEGKPIRIASIQISGTD